MNPAEERNVDLVLDELLGGALPPDLAPRIVAAWRERQGEGVAIRSETPGSSPARLQGEGQGRSVAAVSRPAWRRMPRWGVAAAALCALAGITLLVAELVDRDAAALPITGGHGTGEGQDRPIPDGASKPENTSQVPRGMLVLGDGRLIADGETRRIERGWFLAGSGAPVLDGAGQRIDTSQGRALIGRGDDAVALTPDDAARLCETHHIELTPEERNAMLNKDNWLRRGGLALCVLAGSVSVNGEVLQAQERDPVTSRVANPTRPAQPRPDPETGAPSTTRSEDTSVPVKRDPAMDRALAKFQEIIETHRSIAREARTEAMRLIDELAKESKEATEDAGEAPVQESPATREKRLKAQELLDVAIKAQSSGSKIDEYYRDFRDSCLSVERGRNYLDDQIANVENDLVRIGQGITSCMEDVAQVNNELAKTPQGANDNAHPDVRDQIKARDLEMRRALNERNAALERKLQEMKSAERTLDSLKTVLGVLTEAPPAKTKTRE